MHMQLENDECHPQVWRMKLKYCQRIIEERIMCRNTLAGAKYVPGCIKSLKFLISDVFLVTELGIGLNSRA